MGEVNHRKKNRKGNRKVKQQGKLPFLADVTIEPCQERLGRAGWRAQLKLTQGRPVPHQKSNETLLSSKFLVLHLHSFKSPNVVTPPANLVLLVSLTEDNHQFGNDIRSVWTTLLRQRLVLTDAWL